MKIDRLISIITILLEKERISAQSLADSFEVSLRTIYRDIDTIDLAGIPVRSIPGVGGGFEIMPRFKIDKNVFSTADLSTLLMGLSCIPQTECSDKQINTLTKVRSLIPKDDAQEIELKANQLQLDFSPWIGTKNTQSDLKIIKNALKKNNMLAFDYSDRYGNKTSRTAEPYQLVLKNNHWYWQGYCIKRSDYRLFRVSRMTNLMLLDELFEPRNYTKPQLKFPAELTRRQTSIKIRIHKSLMDSVLAYTSPKDTTHDGDEHYIVSIPFIENDYHYGILFSFGNKCECLEPPHVRAEMQCRIQSIATLYQ